MNERISILNYNSTRSRAGALVCRCVDNLTCHIVVLVGSTVVCRSAGRGGRGRSQQRPDLEKKSRKWALILAVLHLLPWTARQLTGQVVGTPYAALLLLLGSKYVFHACLFSSNCSYGLLSCEPGWDSDHGGRYSGVPSNVLFVPGTYFVG